MAKKFSTASGAVDALLRSLDGGVLKLYSGSQPANADAPITPDSVLLVTADFKNPAWQRAVGSRATSHALTSNGAHAPGTLNWFRALTADGIAIFDGSVGPTEDFDLAIVDAIPSKSAGVVLTLSFELPNAAASSAPGPAAARRAR